MIKMFYLQKAIFVVMAGIAFFFMGCQTKVPLTRTVPREPASDLRVAAEKYLKAERYEKALFLFERISKDYPYDADIPLVEYQIARIYYLLGEHKISNDEAFRWLEKYSAHSAKTDVMYLLGENFEVLEDRAQAFYWFLEAKKRDYKEPQKQKEIDEKLENLIRAGDMEDLDRIEVYAVGTHYAPIIRLRRAYVFLEQDELEKARDVAMSIVQDTQAQFWVPEGLRILEKIREEMSVKKGVVGCLLPLSGPFAIYGEEVLNGIQLGIFSDPKQGSSIELVIRDTQGKPEPALFGLEDLVRNENVMAVIGPLSLKAASPVAKRAQELGIPIITFTQKQGITDEGDMVFRNFLTPSREIKKLLEPAIIELGIKRFGILYPDEPYGRFCMNLFWDRVEEIGGTVTAVESYEPDRTDFAEQIKKMTGLYYAKPPSMVKKMMETRPPEEEEYKIYPDKPEPFIDFDAVFIPDNYETVAMIAPQLPYHDVRDVVLMGTSLWQSPALIKIAKDYVQGSVFTSGFFEKSRDPEVLIFIKEYTNFFDSAPGMLAAVGYDTIHLLDEIMQDEEIHTRKDIRNALFGVRNFKGVTGDVLFDAKGELENEPFLLTVSGRKMKQIRSVIY